MRVGGADNPIGTLFFSPFGRSASFIIRAEADQIGQEGVEDFKIPLVVSSTTAPSPVFPRATANITVIDLSGQLATIYPLSLPTNACLQHMLLLRISLLLGHGLLCMGQS